MATATLKEENKATSEQGKQHGNPEKAKFHSWTLKKQDACRNRGFLLSTAESQPPAPLNQLLAPGYSQFLISSRQAGHLLMLKAFQHCRTQAAGIVPSVYFESRWPVFINLILHVNVPLLGTVIKK